ncbi:hypothetical protein GK047_06315 [Paenibacillus sp. SYP-B3998]|uniref:Uncharacterized protein n=1 Tax=Paenibacillus sp. SYP-B3998 TaxID=2678564 RepID=A0A6G3ZVB0_9BACL|nr:hypothetical protein [Paenibacillus sp. SYP-B3998]NEW05634.1 hypothetical protein [Paenibacillus sp. SYP-B3998]
MKACSQVCGVVFDPLDADYMDVCKDCEGACQKGQHEVQDKGVDSHYLGICGLIIDYLL